MTFEITWHNTGKTLKYEGMSQKEINKLVSHASNLCEKDGLSTVSIKVW